MHVLATYPRATHQQQGARHVPQLVRQARADHSVERVANSLAADPHAPQKNHLSTCPSTLEARVGRGTRHVERVANSLAAHPHCRRCAFDARSCHLPTCHAPTARCEARSPACLPSASRPQRRASCQLACCSSPLPKVCVRCTFLPLTHVPRTNSKVRGTFSSLSAKREQTTA